MIDSQKLDELEELFKLSPKVGPFAPQIFNTDVEKLIEELRKLQSDPWKIALVEEINDLKFQRRQLQEREAAFRSVLKHVIDKDYMEEWDLTETEKDVWKMTRDVLARYPEESK